MHDKILKLELPMGSLVLRHAGTMLLAMAAEMDGTAVVIDGTDTSAAGAVAAAATIDPDKEMLAAVASDAAGVTVGAVEALQLARAGATDPPPPPAGVELDEAKLPWDVRINQDKRGKLKTGARKNCWKYKKQLDPALIATVEAELKAAMAADPPPAPAAGTVDAPPAPAAGTGAAAPPPPAGDTTATTEAGPMDFPTFVQKVTALQGAGRLTPEQCNAAAVTAGLANFMLVANRPDLIPTLNAEIDRLCPPIQ